MIGGRKVRKRYDWITTSFEETIHCECSFYEQCLYDMANIETTSSVLGWNCPKLQLYTINLIISLYLVFLISTPCDRIYFKPLKTKRAHIGQAAIFFFWKRLKCQNRTHPVVINFECRRNGTSGHITQHTGNMITQKCSVNLCSKDAKQLVS